MRIDLKWWEMRSKVIFGHPKWRPFCEQFSKKLKLLIDLKWREMRSKVIFGHPKCRRPFCEICENCSKQLKLRILWKKRFFYWSEMVRNAIEWFSVIQNGRRRPFCKKSLKKKELHIDLKWREMWSKVIFSDPKWPPASILWNKSK